MKTLCLSILLACTALAAPSAAQAQSNDPIPNAIEPSELNTAGVGAWRLRGSIQAPSTIGSILETPENRVRNRLGSPFQLSFNRDEITRQSSSAVKGALFYTFGRDINDERNLKIISYALGVEVDQARIDDTTVTDTIKFQARTAALFTDSALGRIILNHRVDAGIGWLTNSDFDLSVLTLDARYAPSGRRLGRLTPREGFAIQARPSFIVEAQKVLDDGDVAAFQGDNDRLYAGARLDVQAGFGSNFGASLNRLSFSVDYTYLVDLTGSTNDRDLLNATASWALSEQGEASLLARYSKGQSTSSEPVDKLFLGLGFAF